MKRAEQRRNYFHREIKNIVLDQSERSIYNQNNILLIIYNINIFFTFPDTMKSILMSLTVLYLMLQLVCGWLFEIEHQGLDGDMPYDVSIALD